MPKERCRYTASESMSSVEWPLFVIMRALAKRERRLTFVVSKAEVVLQEACLDSRRDTGAGEMSATWMSGLGESGAVER